MTEPQRAYGTTLNVQGEDGTWTEIAEVQDFSPHEMHLDIAKKLLPFTILLGVPQHLCCVRDCDAAADITVTPTIAQYPSLHTLGMCRPCVVKLRLLGKAAIEFGGPQDE